VRRSLAFVLLALSCSKPERPPDVFLVVVDTLRADRLGCYGYARPTSPAIDRLAAEGTLFEDATSQASWTKFSMVSMLQGHYVTDYRDVYDEKSPTLAEVFHRAGYRTIGEVANILLPADTGFARGFDHYDASGPKKDDAGGDGMTRDAAAIFRDLAPQIASAQRPLFVYVHLMDPHFPYLHHPDLDADLPVEGAEPVQSRLRETFGRSGAPPPPDDPGWERAWKEMQKERGLYDQEVRCADREIGRFLDRLRAQGLLDHAVVALVADHGEALYEQPALLPDDERARSAPAAFLQREHGVHLTQSLVHTPFVLWGRGVAKGLRVKDPVENVDLFPTLVELAGLHAPDGLHGRSLAGATRGGPKRAGEEVHAYVRQCAAVRELASGLKLTLPTEFGKTLGMRPSLYSLAEDPAESKDLYELRPDDAERLARRLADWMQRFPTESSLHRKKGSKEIGDLKKLGYAGEDKK
jgi:arylsulfatase A-like enzyme